MIPAKQSEALRSRLLQQEPRNENSRQSVIPINLFATTETAQEEHKI
jgi:hypothetical protein